MGKFDLPKDTASKPAVKENKETPLLLSISSSHDGCSNLLSSIILSFSMKGGSTLVFLVLWVRSLLTMNTPGYVDSFPNFNTVVLKQGFCNKVLEAGSKGIPTQTMCGIIDLILVTVSSVLLKNKIKGDDGKITPLFLVTAIYTLIHGATHYSVQKFPSISTGPLLNGNIVESVVGLALLAVVMIFAPAGLWTILEDANINNALPIAGGFWVAIVALYALVIKQKEFALTYINVTIFLAIYGVRPLLVGKDKPEDIDTRVKSLPKNIPLYLLATTAAIGVMCFEPLVCKDWFSQVGGHVWFDIALFAMLMSNMK